MSAAARSTDHVIVGLAPGNGCPGDLASQVVEDEPPRMLADGFGNIFVPQPCDPLGERPRFVHPDSSGALEAPTCFPYTARMRKVRFTAPCETWNNRACAFREMRSFPLSVLLAKSSVGFVANDAREIV